MECKFTLKDKSTIPSHHLLQHTVIQNYMCAFKKHCHQRMKILLESPVHIAHSTVKLCQCYAVASPQTKAQFVGVPIGELEYSTETLSLL